MDKKMKKIILSENTKLEIVDGETIVNINGKAQKLNDIPIDISDKVKNLKFCTFCGAPSGEYPLFTIDKNSFICRDCVVKAYDTYVRNGIPMPINTKVVSINEKRTTK